MISGRRDLWTYNH